MELTESTTFGELLRVRRGIAAMMTELGLPPAAWLGRTVLEGTAEAGVDAAEIYDRVAELPVRAGGSEQAKETARRGARALERTLGESLPLTLALAAKVASVHGPTDAKLLTLRDVVEELSEASIEHLEGDDAHAASRRVQLEALLNRTRSLTGHYQPPEWGCATLSRYYQALATLDSDLADQLALEVLAEA